MLEVLLGVTHPSRRTLPASSGSAFSWVVQSEVDDMAHAALKARMTYSIIVFAGGLVLGTIHPAHRCGHSG